MTLERISTIQTAGVFPQQRPMTLIEKLERLLDERAGDVMNADVKFPYDYKAGKLNGVREAIEIVKQHQAESGWIACSERLPEHNGYYLAFYGEQWIDITFFVKGVFVIKDLNLIVNNVTHWQPLPQPPSDK